MNKKKIIATASAVALAAMLAFGGTLAYYQGQAESPVTNTLVDQGNSVTISETDEDGETTYSNTYSIIPGTTDKKDPVVTAEFTLDSYVYVKADDTTGDLITWDPASAWTKLDGYDNVYYLLLKTVSYDSDGWTSGNDDTYSYTVDGLTYTYKGASDGVGSYTVSKDGVQIYTYTTQAAGSTTLYTASIPVIDGNTITYSSGITNETFEGYGSTVSLDFTAYIIQASLTDGTDEDNDYGEKEYANPTLAYYYADPDGYYESAVANGNVAAINEKLYSTVDSAVSAANDGETVRLLVDVTLDSAVTISKNITFDLAGSTLTNASGNVVEVSGNVTLKDSSNDSSGSISGGNSSGVVSVAANASLTMESGTITGENSTASTVYGVKLAESAAFTMNGGTIEDCSTYGVYVYSSSSKGGSTFTMNGGTIKDCSSYGVCVGYLSGGGGSTFTMNDGTISGNKGGVYVKGQSNSVQSTFTMNGGTISGNTVSGSASNTSGGVTVHNASFTMNGGTITGNTHTKAAGGGVYINANGTFTMNEGTISNNTGSNGGGVYLGAATSAFTMNGGSIAGNTATTSGGGVHTGSNANTFTMTGGSITENKAESYGGGVFVGNKSADFNVSGSPVINNNTVSSSANNVYLGTAKITLADGLSSGANIGVTVPSNSTFPVQITATESVTAYYTSAASYIKSDSGSYTVQSSSTGGYLELVTNTND